MISISRRPAAMAAGFVAILISAFAVLAQTPSDTAAKRDGLARSTRSSYLKLCTPFFLPRPGGCFCNEDCGEPLLKEQNLHQVFKWQRVLPTFYAAAPEEPANRRADEADDIRVIDLEGLKKVLQRDPKDSRPLLINFWATWCDPCREEFPDLVKIDQDYRGKSLNFVAISLDDITDVKSIVPKFLNEMKAEMPVVLLNVNDPEPAIKVVDPTWDGQLPATFLYDKDGKIVFKHFGKIKPDELRTAIDKTIGTK